MSAVIVLICRSSGQGVAVEVRTKGPPCCRHTLSESGSALTITRSLGGLRTPAHAVRGTTFMGPASENLHKPRHQRYKPPKRKSRSKAAFQQIRGARLSSVEHTIYFYRSTPRCHNIWKAL